MLSIIKKNVRKNLYYRKFIIYPMDMVSILVKIARENSKYHSTNKCKQQKDMFLKGS